MAKDQNLLALAAAINATDPKNTDNLREVGEEYFALVLEPFGFKPHEIKGWLETARDKLARRQLPWSLSPGYMRSTGPITPYKVAHALEKYESHKMKGRIKYGEHDYANRADMMWEYHEILGFLERAKSLLEKLSPEEFRRYRKRYDQIVTGVQAHPMYGN